MQHSSTRGRIGRHVLVSLPLIVAAACAEPPAMPDAPTAVSVDQPSLNKSVGDDLGQLRSVTAKYHSFEFATSPEGGFGPLTGCMVDPQLGGMGFHFANGSAIDGTVEPLNPEVLLYEPEQNGKMKLVAVEYIVPYTFVPRSATPPTVFGQDLLQNDTFQVWARHAWIWKNNPAGIFADWNPNVNCDAVPAAARMSHGH